MEFSWREWTQPWARGPRCSDQNSKFVKSFSL